MNNPQQPREYDAVLGGNSPSLEGAAVLGGIEGVKLRLQNPDAKVRISALKQALNYGEQGLDLVIAGLKDESWDIQNAAYSLLNSRIEASAKEALIIFDQVTLKSSVGMDYRELRNLLGAGSWKEANDETRRVMLTITKQEKYIDSEDIYNFPCEDLRTIDQLWVKYSDGRFGFSVQKQIYQSLAGMMIGDFHYWLKFADQIGWMKGNSSHPGNKDFKKENDITFDLTALRGHLPYSVEYLRYFLLFHGESTEAWEKKGKGLAIFYRVKTCGL
ncbi:GUN4 domain-containing protein [Anabaena sp. UHCC 0187]|uniref:GUN4 domain-containing protein n=1 Tax=Anabaena sp. UHCC 0187 TaxID=2590018 RepID=UPI0020C3A1B9|nr:GUN4 domain-containing protein [Anabaena sp. UHCC 0187]